MTWTSVDGPNEMARRPAIIKVFFYSIILASHNFHLRWKIATNVSTRLQNALNNGQTDKHEHTNKHCLTEPTNQSPIDRNYMIETKTTVFWLTMRKEVATQQLRCPYKGQTLISTGSDELSLMMIHRAVMDSPQQSCLSVCSCAQACSFMHYRHTRACSDQTDDVFSPGSNRCRQSQKQQHSHAEKGAPNTHTHTDWGGLSGRRHCVVQSACVFLSESLTLRCYCCRCIWVWNHAQPCARTRKLWTSP